MPVLNLDTHAHLYDSYPLEDWYVAAARNLRGNTDSKAGLIVVDRSGQDTFERCRQKVAEFGKWSELATSSGGDTLQGVITGELGELVIFRGVQYVTAERLEVLGLGVARKLEDGADLAGYVKSIRADGGVPCLPWSPGKWLGERGTIVRQAIEDAKPNELVCGDITIRAKPFVPSSLLRLAQARGLGIVYGSDSLPPSDELLLVGSYGVSLPIGAEDLRHQAVLPEVLNAIRGTEQLAVWGQPDRPWRAIARFGKSFLSSKRRSKKLQTKCSR